MPDARDLSKRAVELAESVQYDEALDIVNKAIKLDANNANMAFFPVITTQGANLSSGMAGLPGLSGRARQQDTRTPAGSQE